MSVYDHNLPDAFPIVYVVNLETAKEWAALLVKPEGSCTQGSSYAVTSDANNMNHRKFWLSSVSHQRLVKAGLIA